MSLPHAETGAKPFDVVIIGAGAAGTSAASALAKSGHRVALVDFRSSHPTDFRAEKIGERQVKFFDSFGLGPAARRQLTSFDGVWIHRFGRIVEKEQKNEYSSPYQDLVNALRAALPPEVTQIVGRVTDIATSPDRQRLLLADGQLIEARLLVVATGLGDSIRNKLGIDRVVRSASHSVAAGFDLLNPISDFPFPSLVWLTERPAQKGAYLTLFPMGGRMRANFFLYRAANDPWCMQLRREPELALHKMMPEFEKQFVPMRVADNVQLRPIDLTMVVNQRQPGVVLIGDAYFVTCPVTGTGMDKALNDVDRLRALVPQWLATPGMATEKIAQFYDDPIKRQVDDASFELSLRERAARMDTGLSGKLTRLRRNVFRRGAYRLRDLMARRPASAGV